jgi:glycosyltransferase involved in cell wall biosynthesis
VSSRLGHAWYDPTIVPELSVVIPAYNEAGNIAEVIGEWTTVLDRLGIDYLLTVYDDGSRDGTEQVVRGLAADQRRLRIERHSNMGHGPTILRGYREARGEWVLQIDSDREIRAAAFEQLWRHREEYDLLMGRRTDRASPIARRVVTWMARTTIRCLFGAPIQDVNTPYRLVRRDALERMVTRIPDAAFAPNVIMSGLAARDGLRVVEYPVQHHPRAAGVTSLSAGRALRMGWRCFREAVAVRFGPR